MIWLILNRSGPQYYGLFSLWNTLAIVTNTCICCICFMLWYCSKRCFGRPWSWLKLFVTTFSRKVLVSYRINPAFLDPDLLSVALSFSLDKHFFKTSIGLKKKPHKAKCIKLVGKMAVQDRVKRYCFCLVKNPMIGKGFLFIHSKPCLCKSSQRANILYLFRVESSKAPQVSSWPLNFVSTPPLLLATRKRFFSSNNIVGSLKGRNQTVQSVGRLAA